MSNQLFPTFDGLDIEILRTAIYATKIQTSVSGVESRASWWATPRYRYEIKLNFLRQLGATQMTPYDEAKAFSDFYSTHRGQWDSFLFRDPYDGQIRRVRFETDELTWTRMLDRIWEVPTITLLSIKEVGS